MTGLDAVNRRAAAVPPHDLTAIELVWIEKQTEHWIRFGHAVREQILDRRRRVLFFPSGSIIALVRWAANKHGTIFSAIDVLRTVRSTDAHQTVPMVTPGADVLLHALGWPNVERVLQIVDKIEACGIDPVDVSGDHWRHVHNRLAAGEAPRAYTALRHRAFLLRRRIGA